ncbi:MAG: FtsX-like permease family protein, partial [Halothiobacillaceae bacterium]|jgi:putative ABC transport system permease protein|nr:FtsX-like permease family protein [Halothiobacillaceae bacterium]
VCSSDLFSDPVRGRIVSLDEHDASGLNRLYLREGRLPDPARGDETAISEIFALAHGFRPGDRLTAIINGRREELRIVGVVLSPEYIYEIGPGAFFPDHQRFGVLWMARKPLANAYDMDGAFNDVALTLRPGSPPRDVLERLDSLLRPHGGWGAYDRHDQLSHRLLSEELRQMQTSATVFPVIFLSVAAFLLNVVISRTVSTEREIIATLRAFGYDRLAIIRHYGALVLLIAVSGALIGLGLGAWLGHNLAKVYASFYRFPHLDFILPAWVMATALLVALGSALAGTLHAVGRAAAQTPAQGMRPEAPPLYRQSLLEKLGLGRLLAQPSRMILRHMGRRPVKSTLTLTGLAFATAIMMVGHFQESAILFMIDTQFVRSERGDMTVQFAEAQSSRALHEMASLPGVLHVEGFRSVAVRLRHGAREYRTLIQGIEPDGELRQVLDTRLQAQELPPQGLVLTDHLARVLGVVPGDVLTVEVLEGARPVREVPLVALNAQYLGVSAYMERSALNQLLKEGDRLSGAWLSVDPTAQQWVYDALKARPAIAGTAMRKTEIASFLDTMAQTILYFTSIATLLAAVIAFGVVYNSARIALAERGRELASLRVLGFTRGEIAYILLGELGLLTLISIPVGFAIGYGLCAYLASQFTTDLYRIPLVVETSTYAFAASVVLVSTLLCAFVVWRKLAQLDLIAVLKTRE